MFIPFDFLKKWQKFFRWWNFYGFFRVFSSLLDWFFEYRLMRVQNSRLCLSIPRYTFPQSSAPEAPSAPTESPNKFGYQPIRTASPTEQAEKIYTLGVTYTDYAYFSRNQTVRQILDFLYKYEKPLNSSKVSSWGLFSCLDWKSISK